MLEEKTRLVELNKANRYMEKLITSLETLRNNAREKGGTLTDPTDVAIRRYRNRIVMCLVGLKEVQEHMDLLAR